jgi:glycosyltransferase involved in cell wall biosynthesis
VPVYVRDLATGLRRRGWDVVVACDPACEINHSLAQSGVGVAAFVADRQPSLGDGPALLRLTEVVRRERPKLIHAHSSKAGMLAGLVGRGLGIPTIYTPHGWSFQMEGPAVVRAAFAGSEGLLARAAHRRVIAVCASERDSALRWHVAPPDDIAVVRTGRTSDGAPTLGRREARARLGLRRSEEPAIAAWIGRAGKQKGSNGLPALARRLSQRGIVLAALGAGLEASGVAAAITAAGGIAVPASVSPRELLTASDVLVSTSAWEGLPLVVLEALEQGLPVVAYNVGGLREQVVEGRNGHLVPAGDAEALANRVAVIVGDPETLRRFSSASHEIWRERFRPDIMVERIELVYAHVLDRW